MATKTIISRAFATTIPIFAAGGGVLSELAPPTGSGGQKSDEIAVGIAVVGSVAILLITMAVSRNWDLRRRKIIFLPIAGTALVLGIIGAITYYNWSRHWVVVYPPEGEQQLRHVIGNEYTVDANKYLEMHPDMADNPAELMGKFWGDPTEVWTTRSIETVRGWLVAAYVAIALCLAGTLLCVAEGVLVESGSGGEPEPAENDEQNTS